jgi:hypothetical protein
MSIRRTARAALLAMLLAGTAVIVASAMPTRAAADPTPTPLPPQQAAALAAAPADVPDGSSTSVVNGLTVLKAALLPGAETSADPNISAAAAVGLADVDAADLDSLDDTGDETDAVAMRASCWANSIWHQWGTWPYQQRVTDTTYWCAVFGNHITYRTSSTTASGLLCGVNWRAAALIGGGIGRGFTYFTNRASAGFSCQTVVPWITLHTTHHLDVKRTDRGATTMVGTG